jgi:glycosyltransferase involved in cell wall biosynthesis
VSQLQFITAIPQDVRQGSGCYVGTRTLVEALRQLGTDVTMVTPRVRTPVYTLTRILFNETLRWRKFDGQATVGIDADGYATAGQRNSPPHVACIKGVLGDAVRFETGVTRASLALHARLEARHARRAGLVITPSVYCARRLAELYVVKSAAVVPELIDLEAWRNLLQSDAVAPDPQKFSVFSVCRFYPRKRLDVLLRAAALLRERIPKFEVRIAGNGPESNRLHQICSELDLERVVRWLGDVSMRELAAEYGRADIFCLPSVQEGFGIVFLEAMAAGKPIVAARAAAVPEVVRNGLLVEPENAEALADAILRLYRDPDLRVSLGEAGRRDVEQFAMLRVAKRFLEEVAKIAPAVKVADEYEMR